MAANQDVEQIEGVNASEGVAVSSELGPEAATVNIPNTTTVERRVEAPDPAEGRLPQQTPGGSPALDQYLCYETFDVAMLEYAKKCSSPPSWNEWQKVAYPLARLFEVDVTDVGSQFSALRHRTLTKVFGPHYRKLVSCLLYTSPSPRDVEEYRRPASA